MLSLLNIAPMITMVTTTIIMLNMKWSLQY